jgi:glycosyltransferase involved in cell wall biosynthesis
MNGGDYRNIASLGIERAVLINDFSRVRGGAAALVILLAQKLLEQNIKVTLITGDAGTLPDGMEDVEVVALHEQPLLERPVSTAVVRGLYNPSAARMLSHWISRYDTPGTIYHLHNWSHILSASIFSSLERVSDRTLMHAHDYFLVCPNGAFSNYHDGTTCQLVAMSPACLRTNCDRRNYAQKLWRAARHQVRRTLWDFDRHQTEILLIHDGMMEYFLRAGIDRSRLSVARNPSVPYTSSRVEAESNREFVFIGRVEEEKGAGDFLAAARLAGAPARVIGEGSKLGELSLRFPEAVFDGWQSRSGIAELIRNARVIVVPSRYPEPFGLVITEALSSGIPVIVPNNALLKSEVLAHDIGIACNTRSADGLAAAIRSMMDDDEKIAMMSRKAFGLRETLAADPSDWSTQILFHYHSLLKRARSSREIRYRR